MGIKDFLKRRLSIRWKLLLPFMVLPLLVLLLLPLISASVAGVLEAEVDQRLQQTAGSATRLIEQSEEDALLSASFLANLPEVKIAARYDDYARLESELLARKEQLGLQEISFFTPDFAAGDHPAFYGGPPITLRSEESATTRTLRDNLVLAAMSSLTPDSNIAIAPPSGQIIGVAPVYSGDDASSRLLGVIMAVFFMDDAYIQRISNILNADLAIIKDDDVIVSSLDPSSGYQQLLNQGELRTGGRNITLDVENGAGEPQRLLATPLTLQEQNQGGLLISQSTSDSGVIQRKIQGLMFGFVILIGGLTVAIAGINMYYLAKPIVQLKEAANQMSTGKLDQRVQVNSMLRDEITDLSENFNVMAEHLQGMYEEMEHRVEARVRDLNVAANVSRHLTTELELDKLLPQLVEMTAAGFSLYHSAIYLYDAEKQCLVLEAGSGEAGAHMKLQRVAYSIHSNAGAVPRAARNREPVVINNAALVAHYQINPLLPGSCAELAVPMIIGKELVGVLDLHAAQINRFSEDDQRVMVSLAEQVTVAIQNAKAYQEQVKVAEKLREMDTLKSQFLASMSHELRTPLNSILNFTYFVTSGMMGPVTEQQVETLNKVIASGEHLLSLINDILDISKIEAGMMELFVQDVNLNKEMKHVADTAKSLIKDKPVELIFNLEEELPTIMGDRRRIRQIFLNLVSNAIKFTDQGSITINAHCEDNEFLFAVQDTGAGIEPEAQELIFKPFQQSEAGKKHGSGTGLGLPISRQLAEAHDGKLWFESEPGKGSTFYIALPIHSERMIALAEQV